MKLKNNKIVKLKLLKLKVYKIEKKYLEQFVIHFKKILLVVFQFHKSNKKILFISENSPISYKKFGKIFIKTNHFLIFKKLQIKKLLINKNFKKNMPQLVVILNQNLNLNNTLNEILKLKIPIIKLKNSNTLNKFKLNYLFFSFLNLIFKTPKILP